MTNRVVAQSETDESSSKQVIQSRQAQCRSRSRAGQHMRRQETLDEWQTQWEERPLNTSGGGWSKTSRWTTTRRSL